MPSFIYLLAANFIHRNWQEKHVIFAPMFWKKLQSARSWTPARTRVRRVECKSADATNVTAATEEDAISFPTETIPDTTLTRSGHPPISTIHPAQAADEDVRVDGKGRFSFRNARIFVFRPPDFTFFSAAYNPFRCRSALLFILLAFSLSLLPINVLKCVPGKISDSRDFLLLCLPSTEAFGACYIASMLMRAVLSGSSYITSIRRSWRGRCRQITTIDTEGEPIREWSFSVPSRFSSGILPLLVSSDGPDLHQISYLACNGEFQ
jgi:hypothetical protein